MPPRDVVERDKGSGGARDLGDRNDDRDSSSQIDAALETLKEQNDTLNAELDKTNLDLADSARVNDELMSAVDSLAGMVSAGGAPNPEMGGSPQRKSQSDLIDSPEFDRFNREVGDEQTIMDRVVDFFSPVKSIPTVNQASGEFGFTTEVRPEKFSSAANIASKLFDIDTTFEVGDFTSATDVANRRRDARSETSGARSSDRRDSVTVRDAIEKLRDDEDENEDEDEEDLISDEFLDFPFSTEFIPFQMPQFVLVGDPNFLNQSSNDEDNNDG